ncbi:hypothetical protein IU450_01570 [Nocardia abscessus]|nr:hypothetical protein [Nocardia abscessus]MBF6334567.1 hypothetical protein [Nocardia abscessus]
MPTGADISYAGDQYRLRRAGQAAGIGAALGYFTPVPDEIDNPRPAA